MAGDHLDGAESQMRPEILAEVAEQSFENPPHGEHGRTSVDLATGDGDAAHLAAGTRRFVDDRHLATAVRELKPGYEAAHTRADDDYAHVLSCVSFARRVGNSLARSVK
jgi:hypothetical protein